MKIAIVGSSKLDKYEHSKAEILIKGIINANLGSEIITGDANGIDELVCSFHGYAPVTMIQSNNKQWEPDGYRARNIKIAKQADRVYTIATKKIRDSKCYHCADNNHNRTGGCWTRKYAIGTLGKEGRLFTV